MVTHQAPLSMEFSRQEYWSGLPFPSSGDLPEGIEPSFPALAGGFFTNKLPGKPFFIVQFSSVAQSCMTLCNPWTAACQASLCITNSRSSLRLMSIESVMPSSHLILGCPLLLLPPISPSIRVFSNESTLHVRWPKYWSFSFNIIPPKEILGLISFTMD